VNRPFPCRAGLFSLSSTRPSLGSRVGVVVLALVLQFPFSATFAALDPSASFEKANRLYEQRDYAQAAAAYEELLKAGYTSPALQFNLGNAFFKAGRLGKAIAAYRRAQATAPRDPDILANLQFAREQSRGPRVKTPLWRAVLLRLSLSEWTIAASAGLWAVLGLLTLFQIKPSLRQSLRGTTITLGALTLLACLCLALAWSSASSNRIAVVITPQTEVRHGPLKESQPAFTAYDGAELEILDRKDEWLQVTAGPARTGWILATDTVTL